MKMIPVVSSNIATVGYDSSTERLCVQFNGGKCYEYTGVPSGTFVDLVTAESHGKAFNALIKNSGFAFREIKLEDV